MNQEPPSEAVDDSDVHVRVSKHPSDLELAVTEVEETTIRDENPEVTLPKVSFFVLVIMKNVLPVLLQVISRYLPT